MMAIEEYHKRTPIRLREYDPLNDRDYIHITGENSGCWSYVGRQGGVSNIVSGVVRKKPALRTALFGFRRNPRTSLATLPHKTKIHSLLSRITPNPLVNNSPIVLSAL
jgi:hypothetical protein